MESLLGGGLLFCDPRFHDVNGVPEDARWRYEHRTEGRLVGVLEGVLTDGVLLSGHSAPFGGPDLVRDDPTVDDVVDFVVGALEALREEGVRSVRIRARPAAYSAAEPLIEYVLLNCGFGLEHCDLNQHVDLAPLQAGGDPLQLMGKKRTYVRGALRRPYELVPVSGGQDLAVCHEVLAANRAAQGRPSGLPKEYLERAMQAFPGRVRLMLLRQEGEPVAAAVVYRVLDDVDLLVQWGDVEHDLQRRPMDLLAYLVIGGSAQSGARLLDLGPSSEKDGSPNLGLAQFKRSIGGHPGTRKVFVRSIG